MSLPQNFDLQAELAKCKAADDLTGKNSLIQRLIGGMLEQMLQKEMDEHLGYQKHSPQGHHSGNSRNGLSKKLLKVIMEKLNLRFQETVTRNLNP
ncbi:hypothetical protein PARA125_001096 [Parachlamydia sp. AcF125]|nr:hypothetical protein [Parachlamydia sp. AcF125]